MINVGTASFPTGKLHTDCLCSSLFSRILAPPNPVNLFTCLPRDRSTHTPSQHWDQCGAPSWTRTPRVLANGIQFLQMSLEGWPYTGGYSSIPKSQTFRVLTFFWALSKESTVTGSQIRCGLKDIMYTNYLQCPVYSGWKGVGLYSGQYTAHGALGLGLVF